MKSQFTSSLDQLTLIGLTLLVQITFFSIAGLCLCWAFRRRPAARHFAALAAVGTIAFCPLLLFLPVSRWCVIPLDVGVTPTDVRWAGDVEENLDTPAIDRADSTGLATPENAVSPTRNVHSRFEDSAVLLNDRPPQASRQSEPSVSHFVTSASPPTAAESTQLASRSETPVQQADLSPPSVVSEQAQLAVSSFDIGITVRQTLRWFLLLWLAGMVLLTLRFIWRLWRLRRIVSECECTTAPPLLRVLCQVAEELRLRRTPVVLASESLPMPIVTGVLRPKVVLPLAVVQQSSAEDLHIILSHECAHIARRDLWVSLVQRWLAIVYWPHAFVHILNRHLARAREELCDNHVLAVTSATAYAKTLLRMGEGAFESPALAASLPWIGKHWSLEDRVSELLNPNRRTETRVARGVAFASLLVLVAVVVGVAGIAIGDKPGDEQIANTSTDIKDPDQLIKTLAERAAYWTAPASPELKTLEYSYVLGHEAQQIVLDKGKSNVRYSVWQACSLRTGIHALLREPERFSITVRQDAGGDTLIIAAKLPTEDARHVGIEVGNGINGSWRGYYSHSTREVVLTVDKKRLVPLEEKSGATTLRFADWKEVDASHWVPGMIDILNGETRYRMHFEWAGNAVWLLTYAESLSRDGTMTVARTKDVKVNDRATTRPLTANEKRQDRDLAIVQRMLDRNQAWLKPGFADFDSIEYTFNTVREDVREHGFLNRDGTAVLEVVHDGQGKMGDRLGERRIALPTEEVAYTHRDARFAKLTPRPTRLKDQPMDEQLRHCARIGCQFDLPLFRYHDRLAGGQIEIEGGEWDGNPCDVAKISNLGRDVYLGAGTMFGFTSWSYVHHLRPTHELIYIDKQSHLPIHETFVGTEANRSFEIDFADYAEVTAGQWAPLLIRIESKDYFVAEYQFQIVQGKHWMLKEVVSWFDAANKSRGVVEDLRVNQPSTLYQAAMKQVDSSRNLFRKTADEKSLPLPTTPITFGKRIKAGPYSVLLTVSGPGTASIKIETEASNAETVVPVLLLDKQHFPLFATHVTLNSEGDFRRGEAGLRFSSKLGEVSSIVMPNVPANSGDTPTLAVTDLQWGQPIAVNVADPGEGKTRAYEALLTRNDDGTAQAKLTVASSNGPAQFVLDLSVAILDRNGRLVAAGLNNTTMLVKGGIVEDDFFISLGPSIEFDEASKLIIAVTPGEVVSAPMGSVWGTFVRAGPAIPLEILLDADDDACRQYGLQQLSQKIRLDKEIFDNLRDRKRMKDRGETRDKLLAPYTTSLARIARQTKDDAVLIDALRLLGHAGKREHLDVVRSQLGSSDDQVADAAAIAVAMLGEADSFDRLQRVLGRRVPSWETERDARREFDRTETEVLVALVSVADARSVKLLGQTLRGDFKALKIATNEKGSQYLVGRPDRIKRVISVLGSCGNEEAAPWLIDAGNFFDSHADIAAVFDQIPLAEALVQFEDKTRDFVASQIEQGNYAYIRAFKLDGHKNAYYIPAVHKMLINSDATAWTAHQGVTYLWNIGTPEALEVLRDAHSKDIHAENARTRLAICEALAALGDDRGVNDAFEALCEFYQATAPPTDKQQSQAWEDRREDLEDGAKDILARARKESIAKFIQSHLDVERPAQRRAVIELLWQLPQTPKTVLATLVRWRASADNFLAAELSKVIDRE